MPNITVRFFGPARDAAATDSAELTFDDGATVGEVAAILAEKFPQLGSSLGIRLAVNRAYVALDHVLTDGDEVAVIEHDVETRHLTGSGSMRDVE